MSSYVKLTLEEFEEYFKKEMNDLFKDVTLQQISWERVWEYSMNDVLSIRVFSSIPRQGEAARPVGKDAIRVVVWNKKVNKFQSGSKRVNRTEGALGRMRQRCRELYLEWHKADVKCDKCADGYMLVKKAKRTGNVFLGCSNYPKCKHTKS